MDASEKLTEELLREHFGEDEAKLATARARLERGEPLAYIIGEWYFYGETYKITPDCLIPRPDTEHLAEQLIHLLPKNGCFLDLCTGSGCIAISTLVHRRDVTADAVDISEGAVDTATANAERNGVSDRISIFRADVLSPDFLSGRSYDCIVSNPPYIATDVIDTLSREVKHEPRAALDGGRDGLDFYRVIIPEYTKHLRRNGHLILEIGYDQGDDIRKLCRDGGFACEILRDYGGNERVAVISG